MTQTWNPDQERRADVARRVREKFRTRRDGSRVIDMGSVIADPDPSNANPFRLPDDEQQTKQQ